MDSYRPADLYPWLSRLSQHQPTTFFIMPSIIFTDGETSKEVSLDSVSHAELDFIYEVNSVQDIPSDETDETTAGFST